MYAAKHRTDETYIPDLDKSRRTLTDVTREANATPVASPARNMHAMLDDRFNINSQRSESVERFPPLVSFAIIAGFCVVSWTVIASVLLPII